MSGKKKNLLVMALLCMTLAVFSACGGGGGGGSEAEAVSLPEAPTGVSAVEIEEKTVSLQWDPVPGAEYYSIYMGASPGVTTASELKAEGFDPPFVIGLMPGATYYFIVTASNEAGESATSAEVSVSVSGEPIVIPVEIANPGEGVDHGELVWEFGSGSDSSTSDSTPGGGTSGSWVDIWAH